MKTLTWKKVLMLFLSGLGIGLVMISLGWAKQPTRRQTTRPRPKRTVAVVRRPVLKDYVHPGGLYQVSYPAGWRVNAKAEGMVAVTRGQNGEQVIFGVLRRPDNASNELAIRQELTAPDRPMDLTRAPAKIAGLKATKLVGTGTQPDMKKVEYYVESNNGHHFFVLMMAPRAEWEQHNIAFNQILNTLTLN